MRLPHRRRIAASVLPLVLGAVLAPIFAAQAASVRTINDPTGDVRSDAGAAMDEPRADIVEATAEYRSDEVVLRLKTAEPRNPASDKNWAQGFTAIGWVIDTTGDFSEEFQVEYGYNAESQEIYGDVYPKDAPAGAQPRCKATTAKFTKDDYYQLVIDKNCLDSPQSFYYGAIMLYTRHPEDPASPQAEDKAPNGPPAYEGPVDLNADSGPAPDPGPTPEPGPTPQPGPGATPPASSGPGVQGYWLVARDGGVFSYGTAEFHGSTGHVRLNQPIVGMTRNPAADGYWFVAADGGIFAFGQAPFYGSTGSIRLNRPIVGMAPTPSGRGYWLVANDGGIFAFGDAGFYGSTGATRLNRPIVGLAPTPSGRGYWLVASDGGIFAFGDAGFYGSTGHLKLNRPITGMATTPTGAGYWFVASDGGVFAFGDAKFYGSAGSFNSSTTVVGISATSDGGGYRLVRADGGVAHYGNAVNRGSMSGKPLAQPVVGMSSK